MSRYYQSGFDPGHQFEALLVSGVHLAVVVVELYHGDTDFTRCGQLLVAERLLTQASEAGDPQSVRLRGIDDMGPPAGAAKTPGTVPNSKANRTFKQTALFMAGLLLSLPWRISESPGPRDQCSLKIIRDR
jgi:hypothetical protein